MPVNCISVAQPQPVKCIQPQPAERATTNTCPKLMPQNTGPQCGPSQDTFTPSSNLYKAPQTPTTGNAEGPSGNTKAANPFIILILPNSGGGGCNPPGGVSPPTGVSPPGGIGNNNGPSSPIDEQQLTQAAGGDMQIVETLKQIAQDPEGAKALQTALDNGTTFKQGGLQGNTVGLTEYQPNGGPVVTLEDPSDVDTAAHELAHAAYPNMPHDEVYEFGHRVARNLGETAHETPAVF